MSTRFFRVTDDMTIAGRWHLGAVTDADGVEPWLTGGRRHEGGSVLTAAVSHPGRVLDFSLTSFGVPLISTELGDVIGSIAGDDAQQIEVEVAGQRGLRVLNVIRVVRCLDESRSRFTKWTENDFRPDLVGDYMEVSLLRVAPERIPNDANIFLVGGWLVGMVVSERMKTAIEDTNCTGVWFDEVT